jgi:hypothetical protein
MKNFEQLQWIHDRIVNVYGEKENAGFLIKFREIIQETKNSEEGFENYMNWIQNRKK